MLTMISKKIKRKFNKMILHTLFSHMAAVFETCFASRSVVLSDLLLFDDALCILRLPTTKQIIPSDSTRNLGQAYMMNNDLHNYVSNECFEEVLILTGIPSTSYSKHESSSPSRP